MAKEIDDDLVLRDEDGKPLEWIDWDHTGFRDTTIYRLVAPYLNETIWYVRDE